MFRKNLKDELFVDRKMIILDMYIDGKYGMYILDIYKIMNGLIRFILCFCLYWLDIIIRNVRK